MSFNKQEETNIVESILSTSSALSRELSKSRRNSKSENENAKFYRVLSACAKNYITNGFIYLDENSILNNSGKFLL